MRSPCECCQLKVPKWVISRWFSSRISLQKVRLAVDGQPGPDRPRLHARAVGNLEAIVRAAEDHGDPVAVIKDVLEVAEAVILLGVVVQGRRACRPETRCPDRCG